MTDIISTERESAVKPPAESSRTPAGHTDFAVLKAEAKPNFLELFSLWNLDGCETNGIYIFKPKFVDHGKECRFSLSTGKGKARGTDIIKLCGMVHNEPSYAKAARILQKALAELERRGVLRTASQDDVENERERKVRYTERSKRNAVLSWNSASEDVDQTYFLARGIQLTEPEPNIRYTAGKHPKLVCKFSKATSADVEGVLKIGLSVDRKAKVDGDLQKLFLGTKDSHGVWLGDPGSTTLYITEGIEDALSLRAAGCKFVVAAGDAGNLGKQRIHKQVTEIVIAADNDKTGLRAAEDAVKAYKTKSRKVYVIKPPIGNKDWNELLQKEGPQHFKYLVKLAADGEKYAQENFLSKDGEYDAIIEEMNKRRFVIKNYHGKCVVGEFVDERDNDTNTTIRRLKVQKKGDFYNSLANTSILIEAGRGTRKVTHADFWFTHEQRRQYETVVFKPGKEVEDSELNLWQGFSCEPKEGDCQLILDFIKAIACAGDETHYEYLVNLLALGIQKPWQRWGVAVVCRGGQGTGKGSLAYFFGGLFGQHYRLINKAKHLTGEFNAHHRDALVMFADEALATEPSAIGTLKSIITEPIIPIQPKGFDIENYPNYLKIIIASNHKNPVSIDVDDRRMFCLDFANDQKQQSVYFRALYKFYNEQGGKEAFLYHLKHLDIAGFNVYNVPHTKMWAEGKLASLPIEEAAILHLLEQGWFPGTQTKSLRDYSCPAQILKEHLHSLAPKLRDVGPRALAAVLKKLGCVSKHTNRGTVWWFEELPIMREKWDKVFGKNDNWSDAERWGIGSVTGDLGDPPF
jgi:hypothetical protein